MFVDDPNLLPRPELQVGYKGMRKVEILRQCEKYRHIVGEVDGRLPKDSIAAIMDGYVSQGKIPHPYQAPKSALEIVREQLAAKDAELEEFKNEMREFMRANAKPVETAGPDESWQDLKARAKEAGINTHGMKRPEIEEALSGQDVSHGDQ